MEGSHARGGYKKRVDPERWPPCESAWPYPRKHARPYARHVQESPIPAKTSMPATATLRTGDVRGTTGDFDTVVVPTGVLFIDGDSVEGAVTRALAAKPVATTDSTVPVATKVTYLKIVNSGRTPSESGSWTSGGEKKSGTPLL